MTPSGQTLCLCMIVKDEAHVIKRCLASVRRIVDHWIVVDTGSTDGTQGVIRDDMAGLPGEVVERRWVDFAHNRSEALALARPHGTYSLIIDADDELVLNAGYRLPDLDADSYSIDIVFGAMTYRRPQLIRNALEWRYRGVLHEFLECAAAKTSGHLPILMRINHEGRRSTDPATYAKDAAVLETALATETDPFLISRYTFYLAQSYRDSARREAAIEAYLRRASLGFWDQEVFVSLYQAGRLMEALGHDPDDVIAVYQRASEACPSRAEAAHAASRFCRGLGRNKQGYDVAKSAIDLPVPSGGLFVEPWIYDYGLLDEYAVNAYWAGFYRECQQACLKLLALDSLPAGYRARIAANGRFALDKLAGQPHAGLSYVTVWRPGEVAAGEPSNRLSVARSYGDQTLVSVITPTRNRASFLERAFTYFKNQRFRNIEWLILDDSYEKPQLSDGFSLPPVSYEYVSRKLSVGEKRNILIERAKGEIIVQFDDDDYYSPYYVSTIVSGMMDRKADLLNLRGWFLYDIRSRFFGYWDLARKEGAHYRCDQNGVAVTMLTPANNGAFTDNEFGYGFTYAFRKAVWREYNFKDVNWNEDGDFFRRARQSFRADGLYDTTGLCLHILHPGSTSCCFPQHHLPGFTFDKLFPSLGWIAE
ncbi:MAG TPA: glycosyltransferase [Lichenihabitans sp.]|jgi:glycosyltransferase involved in cell wall biosynthesis|nr:glycosyltransferase [Lichenihabitans sp.]